MNLILTWAGLLSFIILIYIILDGFDLGVGILFPFCPEKKARDIMMSTITPVWDGNETWLIFGASALYGAFPIAYGLLLPMLYMPVMIMLLALIFRGLAFEFRFKAENQWFWDTAFSIGSTLVALMQGMILGSFVQGYGKTLPNLSYTYPWMTPFSVLTGAAVVLGYALLGANWLIIKTTGPLQKQMFRFATRLLGVVATLFGGVCLWTLFLNQHILQRWVTYAYLLWTLPFFSLICILIQFYCLYQKYEKPPFFLSIALFAFSYCGFGVGLWPYIIPYSLTFWEAAAPPSSLRFILVGTATILPLLLVYTSYTYYVFRGKVTKSFHY